jgi:PPOX class probable F420-dependent enzyme
MMPEGEARRRLAEARVGRLATADAAGIPHVVPFVFVVEGATLYWAVDGKPKRSQRLKRLANIEANPNVEVVVDRYAEDWSQLWWVRARGAARVLPEGDERELALGLLASKYPQYTAAPPTGPVVAVTLSRVTGWLGDAVAGQGLDG